MVQMQSPDVYNKFNEGGEQNDISPNDVNILLDSFVRILKPPSPQPANRQIQILQKFVQLLNRHRKFTSNSPICLDWIRPFVDAQNIATFSGLGLTVNNPAESANGFSIMHFSEGHPVFPSSAMHLRIWNELMERTRRETHSTSPMSTFFCNQHSENRSTTLLPCQEPFVVQIGLQNPFPFPLIMKNLRLSLDKLTKNGHLQTDPYEHVDLGMQNFVKLPATSNEVLDWQAEDAAAQTTILMSHPTPSKHLVDLWVLPKSAEVDSFEVNGIQFEFCVPQQPLLTEESTQRNGEVDEDDPMPPIINESVNAFVPIEVKGRRLFGTKEQRMSKKYSNDNRLKATIQTKPSPLLAFRPIGGDPALMNATTQNFLIESNADQLLQCVFEVENVGKIPVNRLAICANFPEQAGLDGTGTGQTARIIADLCSAHRDASIVSISEPQLVVTSDRWSTCPVAIRQSTFANEPSFPLEPEIEGAIRLGIFQCKFISEERPLAVGHKTGIRIAIRAWPEPQNADNNQFQQQFYFLFLYAGDNGQCRHFRYALRIRCHQSLLQMSAASIRQLNPSIGLYQLNLGAASLQNCAAPIKLELLRISGVFCEPRRMDEEWRNHQQNSAALTESQKGGEQAVEIFYRSGCTLKALINKSVLLENGQSVSLCFLASPSSTTQPMELEEGDEIGWGELWLNQPRIPDIPLWRLALSKRKEIDRREDGRNLDALTNLPGRTGQPAVLLLKMLWRASVLQNDGNAATIFGETLLSADE